MLSIPACTYNEQVSITKPLTVITDGAVVDGLTYAFVVGANDVTLDGFEVIGTTNAAQNGAVQVRNSSRFTLRNAHIHHAGGACISIRGGSGHQILDSELAYCAQEGYHLPGVIDTLVARNNIHHNNPDRLYSVSWEAGGGKAVRVRGLTFDSNEVWANVGKGLWCDIDCQDVLFTNNVVHDNTGMGIMYEISSRGEIVGNLSYDNGLVDRPNAWWPWGANILVSSSGSTEVHGNTVCGGSAGITVASQSRSDSPADVATGISVHDNVIVANDGRYGLSWVQDWSGPLFTADNAGFANRYWWPTSEDGRGRFGQSSQISRLVNFNATPGEEGGRYLTLAERDAVAC